MFNRPSLKFIITSALFGALTTAALADDVGSNKGQSKENTKFESEGEFEIPAPNFRKLIEAIKKITPKDGRVRITMNSSGGFTDTDKNSKTYEMALETILFGTHGEKCAPGTQDEWDSGICHGDTLPTDTRYAVIPVEFRFSIDKRTMEMNSVELKDLRVGAVRILTKEKFITAQIASYVMKKYPGKLGTFHGFEVGDLTLKGVTLKKGNSFAVVLKADLAIALGATVGGDNLEEIRQAALDVGYGPQIPGFDPITIRLPLRASIGVRAWNNFLVDAYGGLEKDWNDDDTTLAGGPAHLSPNHMSYVHTKNYDANLRRAYGGLGLRGKVKGVVISGNLEKEYQKRDFSFYHDYKEKTYADGFTAVTYTEHDEGGHTRKDSGYNAVISIGYDW